MSFNSIRTSQITRTPQCSFSSTLKTLDLSFNDFSRMPIGFISQLASLENLYFQHNHLTYIPTAQFSNIAQLQNIDFSYNNLVSFELWVFLVGESADLSNNNISSITNSGNLNISEKGARFNRINLSNNPPFSLSDGMYEMYGSCVEVQYYLNNSLNIRNPTVTVGFNNVDFGTTPVRCTCDLYYFIQLYALLGGAGQDTSYPITRAVCTDGNTPLLNFSVTACPSSTVNFTALTPRLCQIDQNETVFSPILVAPANDTELLVSHTCVHFLGRMKLNLTQIPCSE